MSRLSFAAALFALVVSANAQTTSVANPFSGIPSLSGLPVCQTECAAVSQIQSNWTGDYSAACTTTFASSLTSCMSCVANSSIGPLLMTPENQQVLASAITSYQNSCQQAGSPVTINLSSILAGPTGSTSGSGTATGTSSTAANTGTTSTPGGASNVQIGFGALAGAAALVFSTLY